MKTTYRYIIRYPDGTSADVIADNLKSLLVSAYNQVRNRPDEKAYHKQIKSNIDAVREAHAFYIKCNKELAKEKASRQKAIELAAKTNATSNQIESDTDAPQPDTEPVNPFKHLGVDANTPLYKLNRMLTDTRRTYRRWRDQPPNKSIYVQRRRLDQLDQEINWLKQLINQVESS